MNFKSLILSCSVLIVIGCSPTITYDLERMNKSSVPDLRSLSISIQQFTDTRQSSSYLKDELFNNANKNQLECYNFEARYKKIIPAAKASEMLAKHIDSMRIFKKVYFNKKELADLCLTGSLASFAAHTTVNPSAQTAKAVSSQFGLLGALAGAAITSGMKSNYDFEIKYTDISISDKTGNVIYQLPEFISTTKKEINAITACDQIFGLINAELKIHNNLFIGKISSELPAQLNLKKQ